MIDSYRVTIVFPFLVALFGSFAILAIRASFGETSDWLTLLFLAWWPIQSLAWSLVLIRLVAKQMSKMPAESSFPTWRGNVMNSFAAAASIIIAATLGSTPQLWWIAQMWPSKGFLVLPLGEVMLLQCVMTAWTISVFTSTIAPGMRIGTIIGYLMFGAAFLGNAVLLRMISRFIALPYLGGNRIDAFSPLTLYGQRFMHDRPVSRLHLMYATSFTMFAVAGVILLLLSVFVALGRSRRA